MNRVLTLMRAYLAEQNKQGLPIDKPAKDAGEWVRIAGA
jgi:hypothetical protein